MSTIHLIKSNSNLKTDQHFNRNPEELASVGAGLVPDAGCASGNFGGGIRLGNLDGSNNQTVRNLRR